jgi:hypothetical protein
MFDRSSCRFGVRARPSRGCNYLEKVIWPWRNNGDRIAVEIEQVLPGLLWQKNCQLWMVNESAIIEKLTNCHPNRLAGVAAIFFWKSALQMAAAQSERPVGLRPKRAACLSTLSGALLRCVIFY